MTAIVVMALMLAATAVYVLGPLLERPRQLAELPVEGPSRQALLDQKAMLLQSIRDAELDRQTGKLTEADFDELVAGLKRRATAVLAALDEPAARGRKPTR